jgi:hypothetical protein
MKKLVSIFVLSVMFVPSAFAFDFVNYGTNNEGSQCYNQLCSTVYSNDYTLIGSAGSLDPEATMTLAQPNSPMGMLRMAKQAEVIGKICAVLGC